MKMGAGALTSFSKSGAGKGPRKDILMDKDLQGADDTGFNSQLRLRESESHRKKVKASDGKMMVGRCIWIGHSVGIE